MKGVWTKTMMAGAIILGMSGAAMAQDNSASMDRAIRTYLSNPSDRIIWNADMEPRMPVDGGMQITGLIVDCMTPQYASIMLNPPATLRAMHSSVPPSLRPVTAPHPMNDPAAHEPDFALFRLSF